MQVELGYFFFLANMFLGNTLHQFTSLSSTFVILYTLVWKNNFKYLIRIIQILKDRQI